MKKISSWDSCFSTSKKQKIFIAPSNICLFYSSQDILNQEELLRKAYQEKILNLHERYFSFCFEEKNLECHFCFFIPSSYIPQRCEAMTLDILLPTYIHQKHLCCLFVYDDCSVLCFYLNQNLVFFKKIKTQNEILSSLQYLKILFNFCSDKIYCLAHHQALPKDIELFPLLSLFSSKISSFTYATDHTITLQPFSSLIPKPQKTTQNLKQSCLYFGLMGGILALVFFGIIGYQSYLSLKFEKLNQNLSSSSLLSPIEEIELLKEKNQQKIYALNQFAKTKTKTQLLFIAKRIQDFNLDFSSLSLNGSSLKITLNSIKNLLPFLSYVENLDYQSKIGKEEEKDILEIFK